MSTVGKLLLHLDDNRIKNIKKVKKYVDKYENGIPSFSLTRCVLSRYEECKTLELIEILLDLGADPNECTLFDEHFIQIAIKSGYSEQFILNIVRLSLKHNLDVNYVNKYGVNIIQSAIEKGFKPDSVIEMFKMFEKKDFDLILKQKTLKVFIYSNDNQNKKVEKFLESVDEGLQKSENISGKTNNMVMTIPKTVINEMERFGQILSKSKYQFNPTIGREKELENVILSLAQDKKCPILVGESGVGKSSIVHELSYRITNKYVPKFLQNLVVFNLDVNSIVAGTKYRGDFEENIKKVLDYCTTYNIILFIDEIHTIYGAGSSMEDPNDLASIIKVYIEKNNLKVIGTTTSEEYNKYFSQDALKRRFDKIMVKEPEKDNLYQIIIKVLGDYSVKTGISSDNILNNYIQIVNIIIELTDKNHRIYDDNINNPDLAVSIVDKAFAHAKINDCEELNIYHILKSIELCDRIYDSAKEKAINKLSNLEKIQIKQYQKIIEFKPIRKETL